MPVSTKHPLWADRFTEWSTSRHAYRGETAVKEQRETYLPMPSGFTVQEDNGLSMYNAYITRAQFPEIYAPTVRGIVGIIHRNEAAIELPDSMMYIWEKATRDGIALETLHRRVTKEILLTGRYGLLVDAPPQNEGGGDPYLAGYSTEAIINWDKNQDFFVLDESGLKRNGFEWETMNRWRVLTLEGGQYVARLFDSDQGELTDGRIVTPLSQGGRPLDRIPFVVIGSIDLGTDPNEPPLIGVARASLACYRLDADYRHQLYMSGQETLVIINGDAPEAIGAGVVLELKGDGELQPDAKYVGPEGRGIEAHRKAIEDERDNAIAAGARLFDISKAAVESGEARKLRYAAQTATLTSIAQASAAGLEMSLRNLGRFRDLSEAEVEKIVVKPDLKHLQGPLSASDAEALVRVWQLHGISYQTLYERLRNGEIASEERDWEEEFALITDEAAAIRDLSGDEDGMSSGAGGRQPPNNGGSAA